MAFASKDTTGCHLSGPGFMARPLTEASRPRPDVDLPGAMSKSDDGVRIHLPLALDSKGVDATLGPLRAIFTTLPQTSATLIGPVRN